MLHIRRKASSNVYKLNQWLLEFGRGKPRLGGLSVEKTVEQRIAVMQNGVKRGHATLDRRSRKVPKAAAAQWARVGLEWNQVESFSTEPLEIAAITSLKTSKWKQRTRFLLLGCPYMIQTQANCRLRAMKVSQQGQWDCIVIAGDSAGAFYYKPWELYGHQSLFQTGFVWRPASKKGTKNMPDMQKIMNNKICPICNKICTKHGNYMQKYAKICKKICKMYAKCMQSICKNKCKNKCKIYA